MSTLRKVALALVVIGAINWGLIGLFRFDLVSAIFGEGLSRLIYTLVGLSGLICLSYFFDREEADESERYISPVLDEGTGVKPNYGTEFAEDPDLDLDLDLDHTFNSSKNFHDNEEE